MDLKRCRTKRRCMKTKKQRVYQSVDWVMQLPIHIIYDILSRLPMKTLMSCRCVCKNFQDILASPYFAELHLLNAPSLDHSLILHSSYARDFSLAYVYDLQKPSVFPWRSLTMPSFVSAAKQSFITYLAASCNGLVCLSYYTKDLTIFYVCNPFLNEFMRLPDDRPGIIIQICALGFCTKTKKYKVIRFVTDMYCEIHTLGTNYWKKIENAPVPIHPVSMDSSLNGNLHWVTTSSDISNMICSLNLEIEKCHFISPPSHLTVNTIRRISYSSMRVGMIHGLFCLFYLLDGAQLEVYVMKEYGVVTSWTKEFTADLRFNFISESIRIMPMRIFNNGDFVIFYNNTIPVYYNRRYGIYKELMVPEFYSVSAHAPSFVSLKNIARENDVEVVRRNKLPRIISEGPIGSNLLHLVGVGLGVA